MSGIAWENFETTPDKPEENARDSNWALVNFLYAVGEKWNCPCEYPLIVGQEGGRENEKLSG